MAVKYVFVTGGVVSGLGKGITAASLGRLLKARGYTVTMQKFDPYINIDPGTMNPVQHGEVFVTDDGAETDLDLGHYERFIDESLSKNSNVTTGKIYWSVLQKERRGDFGGGTVQVIPHITNEIKSRFYRNPAAENTEIAIIEVGGTVGDIESQPFLEAIRQFQHEKGRENVILIHVTLIPYLKASQEMKTKPTQASVKDLQGMGIQPDILVCRSEYPLGVHVVDASNPQMDEQMYTVYETLQNLGVKDKPVITVFNKIDQMEDTWVPRDLRADYHVKISAKTGEGITVFLQSIEAVLRERKVEIEALYPYKEAGKIQKIRKYGELQEEEYREDGIFVRAFVPSELYGQVRPEGVTPNNCL